MPGTGKFTVNGKDQLQYFAREILRMMIAQPLEVTDRATQFDVVCTVEGSGLSGQAGAIRHGLSHALTHYEPALRPVLKPHGFLTRDSRVVERKKYGRARPASPSSSRSAKSGHGFGIRRGASGKPGAPFSLLGLPSPGAGGFRSVR